MMEPNLEMEKTRLYNLAENLKHFQSELNAKNEMVEELQHELEILNKGLAVTQVVSYSYFSLMHQISQRFFPYFVF